MAEDAALLQRLKAAEYDLESKCEEVERLHQLIDILMRRVDRLEEDGVGGGAPAAHAQASSHSRARSDGAKARVLQAAGIRSEAASPSRRPALARSALPSTTGSSDRGAGARGQPSKAGAARRVGGTARPASAKASIPSQGEVGGGIRKGHAQPLAPPAAAPAAAAASAISITAATSRRPASAKPALNEPKSAPAPRGGRYLGSAEPPSAAEAVSALLAHHTATAQARLSAAAPARPRTAPALARAQARSIPENPAAGNAAYIEYTVRRMPVRVAKPTQDEVKAAAAAAESWPDAEARSLGLAHVLGFRGRDTRGSAAVDRLGNVVVHGSSKCLVIDPATGAQRIFHGHDWEVACMASHPDEEIFATAQAPSGRALSPQIHLWNSATLLSLSKLSLPPELQTIVCLAFGSSGRLLASISADARHSMILWDWAKGARVASASSHPEGPVLCCAFAPAASPGCDDDTSLVSAGKRHVRFWRIRAPPERKGDRGSGEEDVVGWQESLRGGGSEPSSPEAGSREARELHWRNAECGARRLAKYIPCVAYDGSGRVVCGGEMPRTRTDVLPASHGSRERELE